MFRECFLLHRTTRSVFAMDSFVEMGEDNIPHPLLRAGSIMTGNFGRVSVVYHKDEEGFPLVVCYVVCAVFPSCLANKATNTLVPTRIFWCCVRFFPLCCEQARAV